MSRLAQRWLDGVTTVGVSSGACVPDVLVGQVLQHLARFGFVDLEIESTAEEDVVFSMPSAIRQPV